MLNARRLHEYSERRQQERAANLQALVATPTRSLHRGKYGPADLQAEPKSDPRRNPHLLAMAKGMPCLLRIPGVCRDYSYMGESTVVACHSNLSRHGKAGARKADDHYTVWGCMACHRWLDQGPASAEEKEAAFERAHREQRMQWAEIAFDPYDSGLYKPRDRKAARWAFDQCCDDQRRKDLEKAKA